MIIWPADKRKKKKLYKKVLEIYVAKLNSAHTTFQKLSSKMIVVLKGVSGNGRKGLDAFLSL